MELWTSSFLSYTAKKQIYELKVNIDTKKDMSQREKYMQLYAFSIDLMKQTEKINSHFALWIHTHLVVKLFDVLRSENVITQDILRSHFSKAITIIAHGLELAFLEPIEHNTLDDGPSYIIPPFTSNIKQT